MVSKWCHLCFPLQYYVYDIIINCPINPQSWECLESVWCTDNNEVTNALFISLYTSNSRCGLPLSWTLSKYSGQNIRKYNHVTISKFEKMRDSEPTCQLNYHLKKYTFFKTSSTCYYLLLTVKRIILDFGKKKKKRYIPS